MEHEYICIITAVAGFVTGLLLPIVVLWNRILVWQLRWIKMEHNLAKAENRQPRDIDAVNFKNET
jgi:hypothetical protein